MDGITEKGKRIEQAFHKRKYPSGQHIKKLASLIIKKSDQNHKEVTMCSPGGVYKDNMGNAACWGGWDEPGALSHCCWEPVWKRAI